MPGHPLGSVFHGRPDDTGPYATAKQTSRVATTLSGQRRRGESGATNLGPRSSVLLARTPRHWCPIGTSLVSTRRRTW